MAVEKLKQLLDQRNIKYIAINHSPAYTARETAASMFVPRNEFAKAVIVDLDGEKVMAVVPASRHVDVDALAELAGAKHGRLATEEEFTALFPDCDVGAMPPFGSLYSMRVFADDMIREIDDICFNAGTHAQTFRMDCGDFYALEKPESGEIAIKE